MEIADGKLNSNTPRWLHYVAVVLACATFPLVIVGGLVTTTRVGMADPTWPTPPWYFVWLVSVGRAMDHGIGYLIEHGHRQLGWLVGCLAIVLAVGLWFGQNRTWLRWLGVLALLAVVVQGVMGGLRVVFQNQFIGLVHGVFAQVFFAFTVCLACFTGRTWLSSITPIPSATAGQLRRLAIITTAFVMLQLIFGATLRHLGDRWALIAHLITAFVIVVHVALIAKRVFIEYAAQPGLVRAVEMLTGLVLGQLMLGAGAWGTSAGFGLNLTIAQSGSQIFFATAHVSVGALILAMCTLLAVQSYRLLAPTPDQTRDRQSNGRSVRPSSGVTRPSVSGLESRELWAEGVTG